MSDEREQRIQQLFLKASRMASEEREAWLDGECAGDAEMFEEVRSLLHYDSPSHDPLESGLTSVDLLQLSAKRDSPILTGYQIIREIGTGGQAIVYEAIQESTTQPVALKLLRWGEIASQQERDRLRREVLILAKLRHPGIVSVIDSGETDSGVLYVVTELIDGPSLDKLYQGSNDGGHLAQSDVLVIFRKICNAVQAAHDAGIVHRDLKPANILLDKGYEPRVLDFGLAKSELQGAFDSADTLTVSGQFMGSLPWASPEQAEGKNVDSRSDVYSLGVILYQLLSGGEFPYDVSGSMQDVITKIINADPTPLDRVVNGTGRLENTPAIRLADWELNAVVMKSLAKSPADRFQTAESLELAVSRRIAAAQPQQTKANPFGLQNISVGFAVLLSVVAFLASMFGPSSNPDPETERQETVEAVPHVRAPLAETAWVSFLDEVGKLADEGSATRISDGWRVRNQEISFPDVRAKNLLVRCSIRRYSTEPIVFRLESDGGVYVSVKVLHRADANRDQVTLKRSGLGFLVAEAECPAIPGDAIQLAIALLPDRIVLQYDGQVLMQMHFHSKIESWTPALNAESADIDIVEVGHAQPASIPTDFAAVVVEEESPAVEYTVSLGGAALSRPISEKESRFHVTQLTTATSGDSTLGDELEKLVKCTKLERLELGRVTDSRRALQHIARIRTLTTLDINSSELGDDCFRYVAELENLQVLALWRTQIRNPDFTPLSNLASLRDLRISSIQVTDADLAVLSNIQSLVSIGAKADQVSSEGFRSLTKLKGLYALELPHSQVSGDGIKSLTQVPKLWKLDISGSDVCDNDIAILKKMQSLSHLVVKDTQLTSSGIETLRRFLPNCSVTTSN